MIEDSWNLWFIKKKDMLHTSCRSTHTCADRIITRMQPDEESISRLCSVSSMKLLLTWRKKKAMTPARATAGTKEQNIITIQKSVTISAYPSP